MLTKQQQDNLSKLLISEDVSNVQLGLELLQNHTDEISIFEKELVLLYFMEDQEEEIADVVEVYLHTHFPKKKQLEWERQFKLYGLQYDLYSYEDFEEHEPSFEAHEEVLESYLPLILQHSTHLGIYAYLAEQICSQYPKRLDRAVRYLNMLLQANSEDLNTLKQFALVYRDGYRNYDKTLEYYNEILRIDPNNYQALSEKANLYIDYLEQKNIAKAVALYQEALLVYPQDYNLQVWLADALMLQNTTDSFAEGKQMLLEIMKQYPARSFAWNIYGNRMWITAKEPKKAEQIYLEGIKNNPYSYVLLGNLAELYDNEYQDAKKAAEYYAKALEMNPSDCFHLINYIPLLVLQLQDYKQANLHYQDLQRQYHQSIQPDPETTPQQWAKFEEAQAILLEKFPALRDF